ncbi:MAG: protein kinase [Acidobacteriota bacterium]
MEDGARIGPYEIVGLLATGGMGQVYRARDTRLGREVAVKMLPPALAADDDRLRRFEQEARATGLLNHPNILAIYDIGSHLGSSYVVSELLEGQTLRERLAESPLTPRKAVDLGIQIAHGLDAAHAKGIVHRDLKPENLFLTRDGQVKILDFGLAKLTVSAQPVLPPEALTPHTTEAGMVMGTAGYMSPEQVRGQAVDHRSDIFALGSILYEMVTACRAFAADTPVETMNAILKDEPLALADARGAIPSSLERIIRRCLEKRPEERFQSARDLGFALEAVTDLALPTPGSAMRRRLLRQPYRRLALALLLLAAGAAAGVLLGGTGLTTAPAYTRLTYRRGMVAAARFASDGATVVFSAAWDGAPAQLFLKRPESQDALPLDLPSANVLSISRGGEMAVLLQPQVAHYGVWKGTLARVPLSGGAPREILAGVQEADWAPGGTTLAVVRESLGRTRLEYPPGNLLYETTGHISFPRFSRSSELLAFVDHPLTGDDRGAIAVCDPKEKKVKLLSKGWESVQGLAWGPSGKEIWFTATGGGLQRSLYGVTLGARQRLIARAPGPLLLRDVSPSGQVLLSRDDVRWGILGLPPGAARERDLSWLEFSFARDLSPDGRWLLFEEQSASVGPNYAVCLRGMDGSPPVRLGDGRAFGLSPDGKWVLTSLPTAPTRIVLLPTGAGESRTIEPGGLSVEWAAWFPDGRRILLLASHWGSRRRLWTLGVDAGSPQPITPDGVDAGMRAGVCISPDGKTVAAHGPGDKAWLYPVEGGQPSLLPGITGDDVCLRYSVDGLYLFVASRSGLATRLLRVELATGRREVWRDLVPVDPAGIRSIGSIQATPDGAAYAYTYSRILSELYLAEGLF